jgi:hypothetical protein
MVLEPEPQLMRVGSSCARALLAGIKNTTRINSNHVEDSMALLGFLRRRRNWFLAGKPYPGHQIFRPSSVD